MLFYRDGKTATISVIEHADGLRTIRTNGKADAARRNAGRARPRARTSRPWCSLGALPLALKPDAALVANIGFGSGLTTHTLLGSPRVRDVDTIEIERMMVEGARLFGERNRRAYEDPRSHIHIDDAKTFFAASGRRYDIIVSEPSNPWVSGVSTLFSAEFYGAGQAPPQGRRAARAVDPDLRDQRRTCSRRSSRRWAASSATTRSTARAHADLVVVAHRGDRRFRRSRRRSSISPESRRISPSWATVNSATSRRCGSPAAGRSSRSSRASDYPANSDFFPILDQRAPRARFKGESADDLQAIRDGLVPTLALLDGESRTPLARIQTAGRVPARQRVDQALAGAEAIGIFLGGKAEAAAFCAAQGRQAAVLAHGLLGALRGGAKPSGSTR